MIAELIDFPGIVIADIYHRGKKGERHISFDEKDFNNIADAVTAWRGKHGSETNGDKKESQEGHRSSLESNEAGGSGISEFPIPRDDT